MLTSSLFFSSVLHKEEVSGRLKPEHAPGHKLCTKARSGEHCANTAVQKSLPTPQEVPHSQFRHLFTREQPEKPNGEKQPICELTREIAGLKPGSRASRIRSECSKITCRVPWAWHPQKAWQSTTVQQAAASPLFCRSKALKLHVLFPFLWSFYSQGNIFKEKYFITFTNWSQVWAIQ